MNTKYLCVKSHKVLKMQPSHLRRNYFLRQNCKWERDTWQEKENLFNLARRHIHMSVLEIFYEDAVVLLAYCHRSVFLSFM